MYVKTLMDESWMLIEVPYEIHFDKIAVHGRAVEEEDPIELEWDEFPFNASQLYVGKVDFENRTEYEKSEGLVGLNCAWWIGESGVTAIVNSRPVFILGNDGKTIDRV